MSILELNGCVGAAAAVVIVIVVVVVVVSMQDTGSSNLGQTPMVRNALRAGRWVAVAERVPRIAAVGAWVCSVMCVVLMLHAAGIAFNHTDEQPRRESVATRVLFDSGTRLAASVQHMVEMSAQAARGAAKDSRVIEAIASGQPDQLQRVCNQLIASNAGFDAVVLFDASGRFVGINSVYADGRDIPSERIARIAGMDFTQREIIAGCVRNESLSEVLEFQTSCDITPALFDSSGLSVARSVPVLNRSGVRIGVLSTRLRFERFSQLLSGERIAGGEGTAWFVSDQGMIFDEDVNAGRRPPPIAASQLKSVVSPFTASATMHTVMERADGYCGLFRIGGFEVMDGGGIQVMALLPKAWIIEQVSIGRLWDASIPALGGLLFALLSMMLMQQKSLVQRRHQAAEVAAQLQSTFSAVAEGIVHLDDQGRVLECNPAAEVLFGRNAALLHGERFVDLGWDSLKEDGGTFDPADHPVTRVLAGAPRVDGWVQRIRSAEGTLRWVTMNCCAVQADRLHQTHIVVTMCDVTAAREEASRLKRKTDELDHFFAASLDMFCIANTNGEFVRLNQQWERTLGYRIEDLEGRSFLELVHPDDLQRTLDAINTLSGQQPIFSFENRYRHKDGSYRWIEWRATPEGELIHAAARDITESKQAGEELVKAKATAERALSEIGALRAALDEHSLLSIADRKGRIIEVNSGFCHISGYERKELLGQDHRILNSGHHPRSFWTGVFATLVTGKAWRGEVCNRRKDGTLYWVDSTIVPHMGSDGKPDKYVSIRFDITAQKAAEAKLKAAEARAQEASIAKSEFLANMSHEIRTPMTAILGFTELVASDGDHEKAPRRRLEYIDTIRRNGEHLLSIINDILDISKIEAGKMTVEATATDPVAIIRDVVALMDVKASGKGIKLDAIFETPMPAAIESDPVRMRQILVNLVGNAIKFTEVGGVTMRVRCDPERELLTIAVEDSGIGLTDEQMGRLFGAFVQADASTTRKFGGTGLGLRISKRLAEMLGGDISVASTPGTGSAFTVSIPTGSIAAVEPVTAASQSARSELVQSSGASTSTAEPLLKGIRVLLAEDGPDNQRLISFHLRKAGACVEVAENGRRAIEMLTRDGAFDSPLAEQPAFDLILTDMQMPVIDGYQATALLRSRGCRLPIVALTANAMSGDAQRCLDAGCDAYASKPIDRIALVDTCRRVLSARPGTPAASTPTAA
ncbi:MAG: PAS domain S-box protein [Planctomycetota bacterium]|nr:PAS domain S-box protein [Planctomycetota bacterium]